MPLKPEEDVKRRLELLNLTRKVIKKMKKEMQLENRDHENNKEETAENQ
ncbi:MAG: hypothetical protein H0Z35_12115 [Thermoanaerobacteraceae bacterium]|nr:hypothetical protein [Thermoanaerobacteraceae bacterium]